MTDELPVAELFGLYADTLDHAHVDLLHADDDTVEHEIFEELDVGVTSFLHEASLTRLVEAKLISPEMAARSAALREIVMKLQANDGWTMESFRTDPEWKQVLVLADELKAMKRAWATRSA